MSPFKDLDLALEAPNQNETYSEGDTIIGTLNFRLKSDTKVKSISVKAKGDANVHWTEGIGDDEESYDAYKRYFKIKEFLVAKNARGTVLPKGVHNLQFALKIPQGEMPSSFKGKSGKIVYRVEAKISRSWRWPSSVTKEIKFSSKSFPQIHQAMSPLTDSVDKELGVFSKGQIKMTASVNRGVCFPGDTLSAYARICNSSSKEMTPKFRIQRKTVFFAEGHTDTNDKTVFKLAGDTIKPRSEVTVPCELKIPDDAIYTLRNCEIISVEYYLKVYLDISFAFDPEVVFPLLVVPSDLVAAQLSGDV